MKSCSFFPSFHFKKGLAKFTIGVCLIYGFRRKGAFSALSRGASYTRVNTVYVGFYNSGWRSYLRTCKRDNGRHL